MTPNSKHPQSWDDRNKCLKAPVAKGQRLIILHGDDEFSSHRKRGEICQKVVYMFTYFYLQLCFLRLQSSPKALNLSFSRQLKITLQCFR
jgi:hypothetical protein